MSRTDSPATAGNSKERIEWIDCAKGICMLLVVFGHTISATDTYIEMVMRGLIFSFHMPLFFILSSVTFRFSEDENSFIRKTKHACRHLLVPALVIYLVRVILLIVYQLDSIQWKSFITERINVLVYSSGSDVTVSEATIPSMGIMWFLVVLFIGRSLFDYLHLTLKRNTFIISVCLLTVLGAGISYYQWLPLSFDVALAVLIFFLFGDFLKKTDMTNRRILYCVISFIVWIATFLFIGLVFTDYLELASRRYPVFPLCYITAIAGTMFVSYVCSMISGFVWMKPFVYIGRYSLYLFYVHSLDNLLRSAWNLTDNLIINGMIRMCIDSVIAVLLVKIITRNKVSKDS